MALDRREVTKEADAKTAKFFTFTGVKNGPGNQCKAFPYGYHSVVDIKVRQRRVTDSEKALLIKLINESRRAMAQLATAKAFGCQHRKGRPILWNNKGGGNTVPPMSVSLMVSPAGKRLIPAAASEGKPKSARKSLAASPNAESTATILDNLAVKEPFALVASARSQQYGLYEASEDGDALAGERPKGGDGMSRRGGFRSFGYSAIWATGDCPADCPAGKVARPRRRAPVRLGPRADPP